MKLLHIDSSSSGSRSVSRQLTASIVARLKQTTPSLEITYRDIAAMPVPHHSGALLNLKVKALSERGALHAGTIQVQVTDAPGNDTAGAQPQHDFATINAVLDEFVAADIVVLGAPMYKLQHPKPAEDLGRLPCRTGTDISLHGNRGRGSLRCQANHRRLVSRRRL